MTLDPYAPCPCGSGKKLKFCCSDVTGEIEKIARMLEGDQRAACLQYVKTLRRKYAEQPSLMGVQAMLELELEHYDDAGKTITAFRARHPENPVALAEQATLLAVTENGRVAVAPLQQALERVKEEIPEQLYEAIGIVGTALLAEGECIAAMAHFTLQAHMADREDLRAVRWLLQIRARPEIPLLLRDDPVLAKCADDVAWKPAFDAAREDGLRGMWQRAAAAFAAIVERSGNAPVVWKNLALVRSCLADAAGAVAAWRRFAALEVPLDDAVEAEALAQLLDAEACADWLDVVRVRYTVRQLEALEVVLASDKRASRVNVDEVSVAHGDGPPPRSAFGLMDRPTPESGVGLDAAAVPETLGYVHIYGKETDRPARLELVAVRDDRLDAAKALLGDVGAEMLAEEEVEEEVVSRVLRSSSLLSRGWTLPADVPFEERRPLAAEAQERVIRDTWLHLPMRALDGRTPADAAKDAAMRVRVLAAILLLEIRPERVGDGSLNSLREELGLPVADPIDPTGVDVQAIPLVRFWRLVPERLTDDGLVVLWRSAAVAKVPAAAKLLAREIVVRESLRGSDDRISALGMLAETEVDTDRRLAMLDEARAATEAGGRSSAPWDLRELVVRIQRGEGSEVQRLVAHIASVHGSEPGVQRTLLEILSAAGFVQRDGRSVRTASAARQGFAVPAAAGSQPGAIWTPGQDLDRGQGGKKPVIWTPGME